MSERIPITPGTEIVIDALEWREPAWEFDHPSAVLAPVVRTWESGRCIESIVEDLCVDACVDGYLSSEPVEDGVVGRRWRVATLRRRFREALSGKEFPVMCYQAERVRVRFGLDSDGELDFTIVEAPDAHP